jgi:hypothetical protein
MQRFVTMARRGTQTGIEPYWTPAPMITSTVIDLVFVALVIGIVLFWIFVSPTLARKRRHQEMFGETGHFRAWDPGIGAKKRDR